MDYFYAILSKKNTSVIILSQNEFLSPLGCSIFIA